jgi:2-polyprenyl-3-methyl-5-hydroxy-6-metoxy-1,4-benzoquinol methylase
MKYLVCPQCREALELRIFNKAGDNIEEGIISCSRCQLWFPIIQSVPRILHPKRFAKMVKRYDEFYHKYKQDIPFANKNYEQTHLPDNSPVSLTYDYGWTTNPEQLPEYKREFLHVLGDLLDTNDFRGKLVLDAGCGLGRFTRFAWEMGVREIVGFDLGESVLTAQNKVLRNLPNVHFLQADISYLPFKAEFDLIYSIGVVHHLIAPEQGVKNLVELVNPGGKIFLWVYGSSGIKYFLNPLRFFTLRLPLSWVRVLSIFPALVIYGMNILYGAVSRMPLLEYFARYIPFQQYADRSFQGIRWIAQDHLTVPIIHYFLEGELKEWLNRLPLEDKKISCRYPGRLGRSWRVCGRKRGFKDSKSQGFKEKSTLESSNP